MYLQQNRPQDAERVAKRAVTFNKDDKNAYIAYGQVLAAEGKFDEARQQLETAVKLDPKDVRPILLEAQTYVAAERDRARRVAVRPRDRDRSHQRRSARRQSEASRRSSTTSKTRSRRTRTILKLQTDPNDKVAVIDQEAIVYANEKMDADADAAFKRAISEYPNILSAHTSYGEYLLGEERHHRRGARVHRRRRPQPRSGRRARATGPALRGPGPVPKSRSISSSA